VTVCWGWVETGVSVTVCCGRAGSVEYEVLMTVNRGIDFVEIAVSVTVVRLEERVVVSRT
jgi:hypothetical protein